VAEQTLQSFLIKLKYVVDEGSAKKFHDNIKQGVAGLNTFRLALLAAAVGVEELVRRTTVSFASLDGLAKATNTTADSIERLRAEFVGAHMSAQEADATIQKLAERMRLPMQHEYLATVIKSRFTDVTDFMEKAAQHYADLVKQGGADPATNVQLRTYLNNLENINAGLGEQVRKFEVFHDRRMQFAADEQKVYADMHTTAKEAAERSSEMERVFFRLGKSFEVGFAKLITSPQVSQAIEKIATALSNWLGSEQAQQEFTAFLDRVGDALPLIEKALTHIDFIIKALVVAFAAKTGEDVFGPLIKGALKFGAMLLGIWRLMRGLGAVGAVGEAAGVGAEVAGGVAAGAGAVGAGAVGAGLLGLGAAGWGLWKHFQLHGFGGLDPGAFVAGSQDGEGQTDYGKWASQWHGKLTGGAAGPAGSPSDPAVILKDMRDRFVAWFSGDASYKPQVVIADTMGAGAGGAPAAAPSGGGGGGGGSGGGGGGGGGGHHGGGGGAVPEIPNVGNMTEEERNQLGLIMQYESSGRNVMNEVGVRRRVSPTQARGYTAQGYFQILNSNWARLAPALGIKAPNAMAATLQEQTMVALALLRSRGGLGNWVNYNARLRAAIQRGERARFGVPSTAQPAGAPAGGTAGAVGAIQAVIGDSIGVGLAGPQGFGLPASAVDAIGGTTPKEIFERVSKHLQDFAGKNVAVASGSNAPSQLDYVQKTLAALQGVHAHAVLLGVGQGIKNFQEVNRQLAEIAKSFGDPFTGALAGTGAGAHHRFPAVHPWSYRLTRGQVEQVIQQSKVDIHVHGNDSPSATAKAVQQTQSRVAANHLRNMRTVVA
jgi:hypothetical protein